MGKKKDITDWTQKGGSQVLHSTGPSRTEKIKDTTGKTGLLLCAAAIIYVLAKGFKKSDTWQETRDEAWEDPAGESKEEPADEAKEATDKASA